MKFLCDQSELISSLTTCTKALSGKPTIDILEGIYIETFEDKIKLVASNGVLTIENYCNSVIKDGGKVLIPGRVFFDIVRKCNSGNIEFTLDNPKMMNIISNKAKFNIGTLEVLDYPKIDVSEERFSFTLDNTKFIEMINGTIFAAGGENASKPVLTGAYCKCENGKLSMVCIDGYRMAIRNMEIQGDVLGDFLLLAKSLDDIAKILNGNEESKIYVGEKHIKVESEFTTIITTILQGEYVKYEDILPKEHGIKVKLRREELFLAIERAAIVSRFKRDNLLLLDIEDDILMINARSECGEISDEIEIYCEGGPIKIGFNGSYLSDVLKNIKDEYLYLQFNTNISPCVISQVEGSDFVYLVLPVRMSDN